MLKSWRLVSKDIIVWKTFAYTLSLNGVLSKKVVLEGKLCDEWLFGPSFWEDLVMCSMVSPVPSLQGVQAYDDCHSAKHGFNCGSFCCLL